MPSEGEVAIPFPDESFLNVSRIKACPVLAVPKPGSFTQNQSSLRGDPPTQSQVLILGRGGRWLSQGYEFVEKTSVGIIEPRRVGRFPTHLKGFMSALWGSLHLQNGRIEPITGMKAVSQ